MKFKKMILNGLSFLVLLLFFAAPPVFAQDCKMEIAAVHKQYVDTITTLADSDMIRVETLISEAINLCNAGDENGVLQKLAEAKIILGAS